MKIGVLTSLYPSSVRPHEGIFAERRWSGMRRRGHDVRVVHPLPFAPCAFAGRWLGRPQWSLIARTPRAEVREEIEIGRPRYAHIPGFALANARAFARAGFDALQAGGELELVVLDYAWPAAMSASLWADVGIPSVISGRGSDVLAVAQTPRLARALGLALRQSGHWCGVSQDLVTAMDRLAGAERRGMLVPNGVDFDLFQVRDRGLARQRLECKAQGALVLVVGHLISRKDPLLALEAFARGAPPDAELVFVGTGELERELRRRVRELDLERRVQFRGEQAADTLPWWYAACDVLLLTSSREGRPNVVLEALACGRPVVATRAGGTAVLLEGFAGTLVDSREPELLARALSAMLARAPAPQRCREQVQALSWEQSLGSLEACLNAARAKAS